MSSENSQFDETEEEVDEESDQGLQQISSVNKQQARGQVRQLIDVMLLSGVEEEEIENMLRDLADGVEYYAEDIEWYNQNQQMQQNE